MNSIVKPSPEYSPKVLAEGSTTATRSPKLPELRERQRTSWSPGKAGRLPPPWRPYGALPRRCKGINPKPKGFCWHSPGTLLEHPPGGWRAWVPFYSQKTLKIDLFSPFSNPPGPPGPPKGLPRRPDAQLPIRSAAPAPARRPIRSGTHIASRRLTAKKQPHRKPTLTHYH